MLQELFTACGAIAESFTNQEQFGNVAIPQRTMMSRVMVVVFALVVLFLILFVGKFLWNKVGCKYVSIIKPVPSVVELLALILLFDLVLPSCNCNMRM
jgi:sterol desaturase/sphingolipid hydroxylase (fatty acid hydroxylase superfamily)